MKVILLPIFKGVYIGFALLFYTIAYIVFLIPIYIMHFLWNFKFLDKETIKKELRESFNGYDHSENTWANIPKLEYNEYAIYTTCFHRLLRLEKPRIEKIKENEK